MDETRVSDLLLKYTEKNKAIKSNCWEYCFISFVHSRNEQTQILMGDIYIDSYHCEQARQWKIMTECVINYISKLLLVVWICWTVVG